MSSGLFRRLVTTPGPTVAVAIAADHVAAAQLVWTAAGPALTAHARVALPEGAVTPAVNGPNIPEPTAVAEALGRLFGQLPRRPSRVALVLPDSAAKVSLVRFATLPARETDLDQIIRWQVRKTAPFRVDEAQVAYTHGIRTPEGEQELVVALMRRDIVAEYEEACRAAGAHAGVVDLASFNLINAALAETAVTGADAVPPDGDPRDWLLVHVAAGYSTLAIVRGRHLIFFRNRAAGDEEPLVDLVHQTAMYYQDRLGGTGLARALLAGRAVSGDGGPDQETLRRTLEERLDTIVEPLAGRLTPPIADRTGADTPLLDLLAAPIGLLLRERYAG